MVKLEVHDTNSTGATCSYNKEKKQRVLRNKNEIGTKLTNENERENMTSVKGKIKPIKITNPEFFQMQYLPIPGTHEPSEPPVTPTTKKGSTRVSENSDHADTSDDDQSRYLVNINLENKNNPLVQLFQPPSQPIKITKYQGTLHKI